MDIAALQRRLMALGLDTGGDDGQYGPKTRTAVLTALTDGPDWKLEPSEVEAQAAVWGVHPGKIWAFVDIEASGNPFTNGRPTILFEPHRFSRSTGHRFDASHPAISSRTWNRKLYPASQDGRYKQLLDAIALDVDAAFMSASYGAFQILGENYAVCGSVMPWAFAWQEAQTEGDQFAHFCRFIEGNNLVPKMRAAKPGDPVSCRPLVAAYNGTAYRENRYDERYAAQLVARGVK